MSCHMQGDGLGPAPVPESSISGQIMKAEMEWIRKSNFPPNVSPRRQTSANTVLLSAVDIPTAEVVRSPKLSEVL